jgi:hypothetical protein
MNGAEYQKTLLMLLILFALEDERPEMKNKKMMENIFTLVGFHRPDLATAKYSYRNYLFPYKTDYIYLIIKDNLALHPGLVRIF